MAFTAVAIVAEAASTAVAASIAEAAFTVEASTTEAFVGDFIAADRVSSWADPDSMAAIAVATCAGWFPPDWACVTGLSTAAIDLPGNSRHNSPGRASGRGFTFRSRFMQSLLKSREIGFAGNNMGIRDLNSRVVKPAMTESKFFMPTVSAATRSDIDSATNAYMRRVIGEKLGQHLGTDAPMPDRLQKLLDQLRLQDKNER